MKVSKKNLKKIVEIGAQGPPSGFLDFLGIRCVGSFCEDGIRRGKLNFLKSNWDILAGDYGYNPRDEFPEIEMQNKVFEEEGFIRLAWDRFVAQVDEFLSLFVSENCKSLWMFKESTENCEIGFMGPVEIENFGDISLMGVGKIDLGLLQFIRVYDTGGGFIVHCIRNNGEWFVWEFEKLVKE